MTSLDAYRLVRSADTVEAFHSRVVPTPASAELWWHDIEAAALVLGSTQDDSIVDRDACRNADVGVVRRRSGGGAVLLIPGAVTWLDVIVPTGTAGWSPDVHRPMVWLGQHLAAVIRALVGPDRLVEVHDGPLATTEWSSQICFDGLGAGEVLLDGRKLVGMSQRRTRHAARLQCCWYSAYDPEALVSLLVPTSRPHSIDLAPVATLPHAVAESIPGALLEHLR